MLKDRVVTAILLLAGLLGAVFLLPAMACWLGVGTQRRAVASTPTTNTAAPAPLFAAAKEAP